MKNGAGEIVDGHGDFFFSTVGFAELVKAETVGEVGDPISARPDLGLPFPVLTDRKRDLRPAHAWRVARDEIVVVSEIGLIEYVDQSFSRPKLLKADDLCIEKLDTFRRPGDFVLIGLTTFFAVLEGWRCRVGEATGNLKIEKIKGSKSETAIA